jgi:hypothetical protein
MPKMVGQTQIGGTAFINGGSILPPVVKEAPAIVMGNIVFQSVSVTGLKKLPVQMVGAKLPAPTANAEWPVRAIASPSSKVLKNFIVYPLWWAC